MQIQPLEFSFTHMQKYTLEKKTLYSTNGAGKIVYPYVKERDYIPISDLEKTNKNMNCKLITDQNKRPETLKVLVKKKIGYCH